MRNILYKILFIAAIILISPSTLLAIKALHKADMIDLSNNAIICMHQDPEGYLWFGTYDGLNLYNGKDTYVYRFELNNKNSLCSNIIHRISDAEPGYLWISTSLGINKFSLSEREVIESYPGYNECLLLASDSLGVTLAVTKKDMISCYTPNSDGFRDLPMVGISPENVQALYTRGNNQFELLLSSGLRKKLTPNFSKSSFEIHSEEHRFHELPISSVFKENDHLFFVDAEEKLYRLSILNDQKELMADIKGLTQKNGDIVKIFTDNADTFLIFRNGVLLNISKNTLSFQMNASVFCMMKDSKQEIIWIGTDGQGIKMIYDKPNIFGSVLLKNLPLHIQNPIRAIYTDENRSLWFGTKGSGIVKIENYDQYSPQQEIPLSAVTHYTEKDGLPNNRVYFFQKSNYYPIVWIGTEGPGLSYFSQRDKKIHTLQQPKGYDPIRYVHSIVEVDDSTLWLATTGKGLQKISLRAGTSSPLIAKTENFYLKQEKMMCQEIQSMVFDHDSTLFLGSRGGYGVISFNIFNHNYEFWQINNKQNPAIGDVLSICLTTDSTFYIGASSGLTSVSFTKGQMSLHQYNETHGMSNDMIHGILSGNDHDIWLSTNKGLIKYNQRNHFFHNYQQPYLDVTEYSDDASWKCPYTGRLFFGGIDGLTWIHTFTQPAYIYKPDLYFFEVQMDHKITPLNKPSREEGITVPAKTQSLTIKFAAPDYIYGENYEYYYQLENFNSSWISLGKNNKVSFFKLPFGHYTLKVKYHNDISDSETKEYSLAIHVLPPFYLSFMAIVGYFLGGILILIVIIYRIRHQIKKKQRQITRKIKEEQKEKLYEAKLNFFTHITHELCTPLTLINGVEYYISAFADATANKTLGKYTSVLKTNVNDLNELIQEILDFRKAEDSGFSKTDIQEVPVSSFLDTQVEKFIPLSEKDMIQLEVDAPKHLIWNTDPIFLRKIMSNLISNAFKYTKKGGTIRISLKAENQDLIFQVYNTGKGIKEEEIKTIFDRYRILGSIENEAKAKNTVRNGLGLFICHCLVETLGGKITVRSEVGKFAEFTVCLPYMEKQKVTLPEEENTSSMPKISLLESQTESENSTIALKDEGKKPTILVIDDHEDIVWLISETLGKDYQIQKAFNAEDALVYLQEQTPSLIITDVILPKMSGLEFISVVKKNKYISHIPLIIVSAKISDTEQAAGLNSGADAYLTKPFSPTVLKSVVNRLMANQKELKDYFNSPESAFQFTEGQLMHQEDKEFMDLISRIVEENIGKEGLGPEFIAEKLNINTRTLYRRFKKISSSTPSDFIKDYRLNHAAKLLINTNLNVQEIIYNIGISNKSYFYREFARKFNMTPKEYRTNGIHKA